LVPAELSTKLFASAIELPALDVTAFVVGAAAKIAHPSNCKFPAVTLGAMTWKQSLSNTFAAAFDTATAQHLFPTIETAPAPVI
jgi:hypothetical protein